MLLGSIAYCNGNNCELKTYPTLAFPNGVQKRGDELVVALSLANYMSVYQIDPVNKGNRAVLHDFFNQASFQI